MLVDLQAKRLVYQTLVVLGTEFGHPPPDQRRGYNETFECLRGGVGIRCGWLGHPQRQLRGDPTAGEQTVVHVEYGE